MQLLINMQKKLSAYWWCQIIGWGMFFLLVSFYYFFVPRLTDFPNYFAVIITTLAGVYTSHLMRRFIIKNNLLNLNIAKQFIAIVLISLLFSIVFFILSWLPEPLYLYFNNNYTYKFNFRETVVTSIYLNAQFFGIWNLIYFIYHHIQKSRRHLIESIRLESELKIQQLENENVKLQFQKNITDVSLTALRAQMNPHFIFNCLNSIKLYTTQNNNEAASEYLTKFSRLIRLVMENSRDDKVLLSSELNTLQLYIEMEVMRFKEKIQYSICVEKDVETDYIEVPPLLIQPYVENAIWHGLMHKEHGGKINIDVAMSSNELLRITITDNGIGRTKAEELKSKTATKHKSYGMQVTAERIGLINQVYKTGATVQIEDLVDGNGEASGTKVIIQIPM